MSKQTYYFSHDFDPTGDPKMSAMIGEYGAIGYGIFWRIVEMLHADKNHTLPLKKYIYQAIAKQLLNSIKQNLVISDLPEFVELFIKDCIETYELFSMEGEMFCSYRVFRHFDKKQKISELRSEIGKKGAIAKQNKFLPESKQQNEAKEIKGNIYNIGITHEMFKIFKTHNSKYPYDKEKDLSACLQIAYKIGESKGWLQGDVISNKQNDVLKAWEKIVLFTISDKWFSTRSLTDLITEWQRLIQSMNGSKNGQSLEKPVLTSIKKESETDFDKYRKK